MCLDMQPMESLSWDGSYRQSSLPCTRCGSRKSISNRWVSALCLKLSWEKLSLHMAGIQLADSSCSRGKGKCYRQEKHPSEDVDSLLFHVQLRKVKENGIRTLLGVLDLLIGLLFIHGGADLFLNPGNCYFNVVLMPWMLMLWRP